jgi:ABC-type branched-subunit amino acid transport system ATPase component
LLNLNESKEMVYLKILKDNFNIQNLDLFIISFFFFLLIFSFFLRVMLLTIINYFSHDLTFFLSNSIFKKIISQNYSYFLINDKSSFLGALDKSESFRTIIFSITNFFASMIIVLFIVFFVLYLDLLYSLLFFLLIFFLFLITFVITKKRITKISYDQSKIVETRYKFLLECSDNVKEIILRNLSNFFLNKHIKVANTLKKIRLKSEILDILPNQIILLIVTIALLGVVIYFFYLGNLAAQISLIGAFIFSGQRILPHAQNAYASINTFNLVRYSVNDVLDIFKLENDRKQINQENSKDKLILNHSIKIKNLSFKFKKETDYLFLNSTSHFELNKIYSISGDSGIGKSTFLNIFMGLLKTEDGNFYLDNNEINIFNNKNWQNLICYVPQNTVLVDSTILENIGYGYELNSIDAVKAKESAQDAECIDFIEKSKDKFNTIIGENGIKLSGGQRQRLSLAKALYSERPIILLDEATNALDKELEKKIYKNLKKKNNGKIIISISHNKTLYDSCDHIYEFKNKRLTLIK